MRLQPTSGSGKICVERFGVKPFANHETQTMKGLTRRTFLTGSTALAAQPAFGQGLPAGQRSPSRQGAPAGEVDVIIVGAGAAGIAAARQISTAGRSFTLLEATARIGGRCVTETRSFGVPFDRGAHRIHLPDVNPLTKLASRTGLEIYPAPAGQRLRIGRRNARENEIEDFVSATVRAERTIGEAARGRIDIDCARALPKDIDNWRSSVEFTLGPYSSAKDLSEISALDFSRSVQRDNGAFCRQGYGALLAKLAEGIPVELETPVTQVDTSGQAAPVQATTPRGTISGRYMIVTASTNVLASDRIRFDRGLPKRHLDAIEKLKLGSFDHIALELPGNPLGLRHDDLMLEKSSGPRTAALLANMSGTSIALIEIGGRFGQQLAVQGDKAMIEFTVEWLTGLFGTDMKRAVRRTQTTHWNTEPWTLGAFSSASPGGQWARKALMEPIRDRVYFAGEAAHETLWGTVGGAWESGERAAQAVLRRIASTTSPTTSKPEPRRQPQRSNRQQ